MHAVYFWDSVQVVPISAIAIWAASTRCWSFGHDTLALCLCLPGAASLPLVLRRRAAITYVYLGINSVIFFFYVIAGSWLILPAFFWRCHSYLTVLQSSIFL